MNTKLLLLALLAVTLSLPLGTAKASPGYALSLNGTNQYVTVPDNDQFTFTNSFTWEAWVNITKANWPYYEEWATILAKDCFTNETWFSVYTNGNFEVRLARQSYAPGWDHTVAKVALKTWQHVAVTWDGASVRYYLNGVPKQTNAFSGTLANTTNGLFIGRDRLLGYHFGGQMDELRLWNLARSPGQIVSNMNRCLTGAEPGLVAYWQFESSVTNSAVLTGSACNGSLSNAPSFVVSGAPFVPDAATLNPSAVGAVSVWGNGTVNPNNLPTAVWFQFGATTNYGNLTAITNLSATNDTISVASLVAGLTPGQSYHCQIVASNSAGVVTGADVVWTNLILPPAVATLGPSEVLYTNAMLNATVNPNGQATTVWFEWGTTLNYGNVLGLNLLAADAPEASLSSALEELSRGQTVHYRVVATNTAGRSTGSDMSFTTRLGTNTVMTLADSGAGSLRQAIADSIAGETVVFATNGTVSLTSGELIVTNSLTFAGPGAANLSISGNHSSRVFNISSAGAVVVISDLTISDGHAADGGRNPGADGGSGSDGGGIYNLGALTLNRCVLKNNQAGAGGLGASCGSGNQSNPVSRDGGAGGNGGGIFSIGTLTLNACTLTANAAGAGGAGGQGINFRDYYAAAGGPGGDGGDGGPGGKGGGVYTLSALAMTACTVVGNAAGGGGPGGNAGPATVWDQESPSAGGDGGDGAAGGAAGGLYSSGSLQLTACTIVANRAGVGGAAGSGTEGANPCAANGTNGLSGNNGTIGGLLQTSPSPASVWNCLLASNCADTNAADADIRGAFTSRGHNFIRVCGSATGFTHGLQGDILGSTSLDPRVGTLADNGGPTPTIALLDGCPAIDTGDDSLVGLDQRGYPRPVGAHGDIGALEQGSVYLPPGLSGVAHQVRNLASGMTEVTFSFSVNPNRLSTTAWVEYGVSTNYGVCSGALALGYSHGFLDTNLTVAGFAPGTTYHYRISSRNPAGTIISADQTFTTTPSGDLNGDGVVSADELSRVQGSYLATSPWLYLTNVAGLGGTNVSFNLTNDLAGAFIVQYSTDLENWTDLGTTAHLYQFIDTNAPANPQRYYRLRCP